MDTRLLWFRCYQHQALEVLIRGLDAAFAFSAVFPRSSCSCK